MTINTLYEQFSQATEWQRLAAVMAPRVRSIILRKYGDTEAATLTREQLHQWLQHSQRPPEDTVPTESVITHAMTWAGLWSPIEVKATSQIAGNKVPKIKRNKQDSKKDDDRIEERQNVAHVDSHEDRQRGIPQTNEPDSAGTRPTDGGVAEKQATPNPSPVGREKEKPRPSRKHRDRTFNIDAFWPHDTRPRRGYIYHDTASKGYSKSGKRVFHDCWRATIMVDGHRYRHRSQSREDCEEWLKAVCAKKILPTDNKADWWRMEQRKDDNIRNDEIIVSQAEEAVMLYEYHQSGDFTKIYEYLQKRLLPHMAWYCARTLQLGKVATLTASRQAAALLLTRIAAGKPILSFTATCKRMLRVYKQRGNFFYYENAPDPVKILVNGINFDGMAEIWKVTKDKRI